MHTLRWTPILLAATLAMAVSAQTTPQAPTAAQGTGTVSGVVIARDTQRPIRLAQVQLQNVSQGRGEGGGLANFAGGPGNVRTDIDGTFVAAAIAPGDYYVTATATGYIAEAALLQAKVQAGADPAALLAALPVVHVTAGTSSNATITLERGGALGGHVEWEDGSPAAGVPVQATPAALNSLPTALRGLGSFGGTTAFATTDDRGNFRITGLPTADYVVSAVIQPSSQSNGFARGGANASPIRIYAPGVFRKAKAATIGIRAGDERTDIRLSLDLRGLHVVSGAVVSASPGQAVASGRVSLTDASDTTLQISGALTAQGTFRLPYVPPGTYTLQIYGASTSANSGFNRRGTGTTSSTAFQPSSQTLIVGEADVSGVAITLTPVAPATAP